MMDRLKRGRDAARRTPVEEDIARCEAYIEHLRIQPELSDKDRDRIIEVQKSRLATLRKRADMEGGRKAD